LTPTPDTRTPKRTMLIGRIQQVAEPNPVSPLLHRENPQPDHAGGALHGQASKRSYPTDFRGLWAGPFVVLQMSGETKEGDVLFPGRMGDGKVGFVEGKDKETDVSPLPIVYFQLTDENKMHLHIPLEQAAKAWVGFEEAHNVTLGSGAIKNSQIVSNVIRT